MRGCLAGHTRQLGVHAVHESGWVVHGLEQLRNFVLGVMYTEGVRIRPATVQFVMSEIACPT